MKIKKKKENQKQKENGEIPRPTSVEVPAFPYFRAPHLGEKSILH